MRKTPESEADILDPLYSRFSVLAQQLPFGAETGRRAKHNGHLHARADEVIDGAAEALQRQPGLFPDIPIPAAELKQDQRAAASWLSLARLFAALAALCITNYLRNKTRALIRAKQATATVREACNHPERAPQLDHERRQELMMPAILAGWEDQQGRAKKRAQKQQARKQQAPQKALTQGQQRAQQERARKRAAERRDGLQDLLHGITSSWDGPG